MKLLFLTFLFFSCHLSYGQHRPEKDLAFGLQGGFNASGMHEHQDNPEYRIQDIYGLAGGVFAEWRFARTLYLKSAAIYAGQGNYSDYGDDGETKRLKYINVPLLLQFRKPGEAFGFFAGPQYGALVSAKSKRTNRTGKTDIKGHCNDHDISAVIGIVVEPVGTSFGFSASYQRGITPVFNNKADGDELRFSVFSLNVQYKW